MKRTRVLSALAAAFATMPVFADALTWTGSTSGAFSAAGNWSSDGTHTTPQAGDTVTFNASVTLTAESFALGSGTLTFDVASGKTVTANVSFSGDGVLAKTGSGTLYLKAASSYSGGTTVSDGQVKIDNATSFGTGTVTVSRGAGRTPNIYLEPNGKTVANDVVITGPFLASVNDITFNNSPKLTGSITCDGSLTIDNIYGHAWATRAGSAVFGKVTTGGGTLYARKAAWFANEQDCSIVVLSMWDQSNNIRGGIYFGSGYANANADAVITNAVKGLVQFEEGSSFAGREVVSKGVLVTNVLNGASCFGADTVVKLLDGATLQVASFVRVPHLVVDEAEIPAGAYTAANFPVSGRFVGAGTLCVGAASSVSTWKGGSFGTWTDAANWDNGVVPLDGQVAVFNSAVRVGDAGTVTIGEGGLTVVCNGNVTVSTNVTITGVGKLTKAGAKTLTFENMNQVGTPSLNAYTGGTEILAGMITLHGVNDNKTSPTTCYATGLGPGPVTIRRAAGCGSCIRQEMNAHLTNNAVTVLGPYTAGEQTFCVNNDPELTAPITAADDIRIFNVWSNNRAVGTKVGDISAHGHTVYAAQAPLTFTGDVDASFVAETAGLKYTNGRFTDPDASYTVLGGTNVVSASATIACRDVVVSNVISSATIQLNGAGNLSREAKVSLWNGGRVDVKSGVRVKVAELWVDGVQQPIGVYSAAGVPSGATVTAASFPGGGRLRVGELGAILIVR